MKHNQLPQHTVKPFPEFLRISAAEELFGIRKGKLYELMKTGKISYSEIRDRGALRGVRLIATDSLRNFIHDNIVPPVNSREVQLSSEESNNQK